MSTALAVRRTGQARLDLGRSGRGGNSYASGRGGAASGPGGGGGARRLLGLLGWLLGLALCATFVVAVSVGLLVGFRWLTSAPYFALKEISVAGNERLSSEEILALVDVPLGANTLDIDIAEVEARVSASPWVGTVAVRRKLPAGLAVTVTERQPRWWVGTGRGLFYAEADGAVIAPVLGRRFLPLPVLEVTPEAGGTPAGLEGMMAAFAALDLPIRPMDAAWVRVLAGRLELFFEDRGLTVAASVRDWDRSMERLGLVWADLVRRGEDRAAREIRIFGGKVWVRT
jgi:cell division protein FtsQ